MDGTPGSVLPVAVGGISVATFGSRADDTEDVVVPTSTFGDGCGKGVDVGARSVEADTSGAKDAAAFVAAVSAARLLRMETAM